MLDDLLDAQEPVDWAVAQINVLRDRIHAWRQGRPYIAVAEPDTDPAYNIIKARLQSPMPRIINAEAGAIIHMIRSGLDLLAVALAERNGHIRPKDTYFPITKTRDGFFED